MTQKQNQRQSVVVNIGTLPKKRKKTKKKGGGGKGVSRSRPATRSTPIPYSYTDPYARNSVGQQIRPPAPVASAGYNIARAVAPNKVAPINLKAQARDLARELIKLDKEGMMDKRESSQSDNAEKVGEGGHQVPQDERKKRDDARERRRDNRIAEQDVRSSSGLYTPSDRSDSDSGRVLSGGGGGGAYGVSQMKRNLETSNMREGGLKNQAKNQNRGGKGFYKDSQKSQLNPSSLSQDNVQSGSAGKFQSPLDNRQVVKRREWSISSGSAENRRHARLYRDDSDTSDFIDTGDTGSSRKSPPIQTPNYKKQRQALRAIDATYTNLRLKANQPLATEVGRDLDRITADMGSSGDDIRQLSSDIKDRKHPHIRGATSSSVKKPEARRRISFLHNQLQERDEARGEVNSADEAIEHEARKPPKSLGERPRFQSVVRGKDDPAD